MNLNRLLDQPYLDLSSLPEVDWVKGAFISYFGPEARLLLNFLSTYISNRQTLCLSVDNQLIQSREDLENICFNHLLEMETILLNEIYASNADSQFNHDLKFNHLLLPEKLNLLGFQEYESNRNILFLLQKITQVIIC